MILPIAFLFAVTVEPIFAAPIRTSDINIEHSITVKPTERVILTDGNEIQSLENISELIPVVLTTDDETNERILEERIDPSILSFWKKVKHAFDKGLKKLGDQIVNGLAGAILGGIAG